MKVVTGDGSAENPFPAHIDIASTRPQPVSPASSGNVKDVDLRAPKISEKEFQQQVQQLATFRGWHWLHISTAQYRDDWRTPYSGDLGKGWPDLFLVRGERTVCIELKSEAGKATIEQQKVLALLEQAGIMARLYYPSDWDLIEEVLR